jgi:TrmH family RNA methyltransferase
VHDAISAQWERLRSQQDVVVLEGFHAIKHALRFGGAVDAIVTTSTAALRKLAQELAPDIEDAITAPAQTASAAEIAQLLGRVHQTEVAALARRPAWPEAARPAIRPSPAVLLENPRNLGNIGAVIRVAAGLGLSAVHSTGTVDPWHPTVLRGSAGLHYALPVRRKASIFVKRSFRRTPCWPSDPNAPAFHPNSAATPTYCSRFPCVRRYRATT